jgi:hypothetical protein
MDVRAWAGRTEHGGTSEMKTRKYLWQTCSVGLVALAAACGSTEEPLPVDDPQLAAEVEASLKMFESNPSAFLNTRPQKLTADATLPFTTDIGSIAAKHDMNFGIREDDKLDAPAANDQARDLVDSLVLTKLSDMDAQGLKSAKLAESPWSDDYWGLYAGSIAKRYADPKFSVSDDWKKNTDQLKTAATSTDVLSPAEKWDLLVGDAGKTMTNYNINTGKGYYERSGKVETWMGICHGWAPAAYMVPRPQKTVEVTAADGTTKIKFYPSDLKALASSLWANARASTRFIGGRCNTMNPAKDEIGRIKDQACRDTNAGTWHLSIVNQIGKAKRSFVLDATFDYEVWNQPVYSYSYSYFNPKTNQYTSSLASATVKRTDFTTTQPDKFAKYRAANSVSIVGVAMDVKWVVETRPSTNSPDSPSRDAISGARYLYTLELDAAGNIVGGEWLQNAHPDFLWTPPVGAKPSVTGDPGLAAWDGKTALPQTVRTAAASKSLSGVPLPSVLDALVKLSRQ